VRGVGYGFDWPSEARAESASDPRMAEPGQEALA
jgi:hypothetical protein